MAEEDQSKLTPDEAGAFVVQWAERRDVEISELVKRLGVDEAQATSLLRQARGRLHMQAWLQEQRPSGGLGQKPWFLLGVAFVVGGIVGCIVMSYLHPATGVTEAQARPLPPPPVTVSSNGTLPENNPSMVPLSTGNRVSTQPPFASDETQNPAAARIGDRAGAVIGDLTGGLGQRPAAPQGVIQSRSTLAGKPTSASTEMLVYHDLTNTLRTQLAADIDVELDCPAGYFTVHGLRTEDYTNALKLKQRDLEIPMVALMNYAIKWGKGKPHAQDVPTARIRIHVGAATASSSIHWNDKLPDQLESYKDSGHPVYGELSSLILQAIRHFGPKLFAHQGLYEGVR